MLRLVDQDAKRLAVSDPVASEAVSLLRAATPYEAPAGRKQRVRAALLARPQRRAPLVLRPVVVIAVLVGGGAIASAALGHLPDWVRRAYERLAPAAARAPVATAAREHRVRRTRPAEPSPAAIVTMPPAAPPAPEPATAPLIAPPPPARAATLATRPALARHREGAILRARPAPQPDAREQTGPVLAAMQALRRDHDPARARALLDAYLARHPNGAMAEEALAISIEAAAARHDPDAAQLASRYLARYPTGPFCSLARQTLAGRGQ